MLNLMDIVYLINDLTGIQPTWFLLLAGLLLGPLCLALGVLRDPSVILSFNSARRAAFAVLWKHIADPIDIRYAKYKKPLLGQPSGIVLDLGSGLGGNLKYFDPKKITKLYLVEPNKNLHDGLSKNALSAGFKAKQFEIVSCGAEERSKVEQLTGLGKESVDSVVSVLALCGIPKSRVVISALYEYIKPGGTFYYFEHVASKDSATRTRQNLLTPVWSAMFGGCCLNRSTDLWILEGFEWSEKRSHTLPIENQKYLDVKSYGWAKKPHHDGQVTSGGPSFAEFADPTKDTSHK